MNKTSLNNFRKHLFLLFLVGALTFFIFTNDSLAETDPSVFGIKQMAAAEKSGDIFILNGDGDVAIYDIKKKEFLASSVNTSPSRIDLLMPSPSGEYFAGVTINQLDLLISIYNTDNYL